MAALIEAIDVKRKMAFEHEGTPYYCLEVSTPTARGGQTLIHSKMRNLATHGEIMGDVAALEDFTVIAKLREAEEGQVRPNASSGGATSELRRSDLNL